MENNIKLYKCYKGTCSKCLNEENPYLTEDEYKDLLDVEGKLQCPEGHLDCGIQELKPEDYPKQPKDKKKLFLLGGGILILLLIIGGVFAYINFQKNKIKNVVEIGKAVIGDDNIDKVKNTLNEGVTKLLEEANLFFKNKDYEKAKQVYKSILAIDPNNQKAKQSLIEIDRISLPPQIDKKEDKGEKVTDPSPRREFKTLKFDYGTYKGDILNGLRDGQGVMTFTERYLISPKDLKKRYAEVGDYVSGTWVEGNIVNGKLFNKNGEQKETLLIGH
ncbi:MAG: tetratricopeptide repeat protein [Lentimicrobium sp.]|jgi:tetratricopeptide (TPR) repeat protein|nr:tetratricopeptide repeat protein [Lentimicrobium sp.]